MSETNPASPIPETEPVPVTNQSGAGTTAQRPLATTTVYTATAPGQCALPALTDGVDATPRATEVMSPAAGQAAPRALKLVLTLRPENRIGYRAVLALGADGCDPLLRSIPVGSLEAALEEVAALVTEAKGRWRHQPRNADIAVPRSKPGAAHASSDNAELPATDAATVLPIGAAGTKQAVASQPTPSAVPPAAPSKAHGQLSLFD